MINLESGQRTSIKGMSGQCAFAAVQAGTGIACVDERGFFSDADARRALVQYRAEGLAGLDGMCRSGALVLCDERADRLVIAADPAGHSSFFYACRGRTVLIASSLREIDRAIPLSLDLRSLMMYLSGGLIPGESTVFDDVRKVPPGGYVSFEKGKVRKGCFPRNVRRPAGFSRGRFFVDA